MTGGPLNPPFFDDMTDPFAALFEDINQDYEAALSRVETGADGVRHWRDVVFAHVLGFRPLMVYVSVPRAERPPPLVVFIHGGAWRLGHPMVTNPVYARLDFLGKYLKAGFAVARVSYRFTSEGKFPTQLHDCKAAVRFLRNRARLFGVDPDRFATAIEQMALAYRFKAKDKAAATFDASFLPAPAERSLADSASR